METPTATLPTSPQNTQDDSQDLVIEQPPPQPQLEPRMLVTLTISASTIQREWAEWPEIAAAAGRMKFKRYHAYVYMSTIYDPLGLWKARNRPPNPPPEKLRLAFIGPAPPKPEFLHGGIGFHDPTVSSELYHPIGFKAKRRLPVSAERKENREPIRVHGPEFQRCNVEPAYLYTGRRIEVIGITLSPSARGPENRWMIATYGEDDRLGESFLEDDFKVRQLSATWDKDHPGEAPAGYTMEGETVMLEGINANIDLASYSIPVEVSLDLDDQDKLEDPCDFVKEVVAIRSTLYRKHKKLNGIDQAEEVAPVDAIPVDATPVDATPLDAAPLDAAPLDADPSGVAPLDVPPPDVPPPVVPPLDVPPPDAAPLDMAPVQPKQNKKVAPSRINWPAVVLSGTVVTALSLILLSRTARRA